MRASRIVRFAMLALVVQASLPTGAGLLGPACLVGSRPAASLLFPYFEVDLADPGGATTLVSIGNAFDRPVLAHVVVWTDWGVSSLAFDLALGASEVRSLSVRSILLGRLPVSGNAGTVPDAPSCEFPIPPPPIDLDELQARHTGQPSPFSGLCYGSGRLGAEVATGFLTVDVVHDCSAGALPTDGGYFDDGQGLAANDNALFGDFFLLHPGEDFAQGFAAVPLVADADLFEPTEQNPVVPRTFYWLWNGYDDSDDRAPLSPLHRARFLHGGGFDGTTDLLIWTGGVGSAAGPQPCGGDPWADAFEFPVLDLHFRDQAGETLATTGFVPSAMTFRYAIDGDEVPLELGTFGSIDVRASSLGCLVLLPCQGPLQSWVAPLIGASGRFSVGLEATALEDPCL